MTRNQVLENYDVDHRGMITSPGKFEREMLYVPYLWDQCLDGLADLDMDGAFGIEISEKDLAEFPELSGIKVIALEESDSGFVNSAIWDSLEALEEHLLLMIDGDEATDEDWSLEEDEA